MLIRPATISDVSFCAKIYDEARAFMRSTGNPTQWPGNYPGENEVLEGIKLGTSYVCEDCGEIVATFHFDADADDPTYREIYEGCWKNDHTYGVIHRIAVKYHRRGIIDFCYNECFKITPNLKIDTHRDNLPMQKSLLRSGFEYCGIIYLKNGEERLAYQKTK